MKSRGGEPRGWKTGTVSQGAVMRESGGWAQESIDESRLRKAGSTVKTATTVIVRGQEEKPGTVLIIKTLLFVVSTVNPCPSNFLLL